VTVLNNRREERVAALSAKGEMSAKEARPFGNSAGDRKERSVLFIVGMRIEIE